MTESWMRVRRFLAVFGANLLTSCSITIEVPAPPPESPPASAPAAVAAKAPDRAVEQDTTTDFVALFHSKYTPRATLGLCERLLGAQPADPAAIMEMALACAHDFEATWQGKGRDRRTYQALNERVLSLLDSLDSLGLSQHYQAQFLRLSFGNRLMRYDESLKLAMALRNLTQMRAARRSPDHYMDFTILKNGFAAHLCEGDQAKAHELAQELLRWEVQHGPLGSGFRGYPRLTDGPTAAAFGYAHHLMLHRGDHEGARRALKVVERYSHWRDFEFFEKEVPKRVENLAYARARTKVTDPRASADQVEAARRYFLQPCWLFSDTHLVSNGLPREQFMKDLQD